VDEEHTFLGVQQLVRSGIAADFAVVAEPTNLDVVTAHKGVARWQIETTGRACHSSRPQDGENAIYHMARVIYEVENYSETLADRKKDPVLGRPTISLGRIEGGTSPNTVPDYCKIEVDRRLVPGESPTGAVADLEAFLTRDPNTADLPFKSSTPSLACPALSPHQPEEFVARLDRAIAAVAGPHARIAVPYGTDASSLAEAGIPSVVFGPGDIAQAHTKDEWVELKQVEWAAEILFRFATG
jgi:acetylornithine deacetylase